MPIAHGHMESTKCNIPISLVYFDMQFVYLIPDPQKIKVQSTMQQS